MKLIIFALCVLMMVQGSDPETVFAVFVKRGDDLRLAGPQNLKLTEFGVFYWKHENVSIIKCDHNLNCKTHQKYKGRAEFFKENNSLLLKKVMFNDSGVYTAVIHDGKFRIKENYNVNVQDFQNSPKSSSLSTTNWILVGLGLFLALFVFVVGFFIYRYLRNQSNTRDSEQPAGRLNEESIELNQRRAGDDQLAQYPDSVDTSSDEMV